MLSTHRQPCVSYICLLLAIGLGLPGLLLLLGGTTARAATHCAEPAGAGRCYTATADCYAATSGNWSVVFAACADSTVATGVWNCGRDSFTPTHVVRNGVTGLSPWAVWAQEPATTTLTSSPNPSAFGQAVTFTATVAGTSAGAAVPSGLVTIGVDGSPVLTPTLDAGGVTTIRLATLSAGSHTVTAYYSGDATYRSGAAPDYAQVVQPLPLAVNDAAGTLQDEAVTIHVLANDLDPAGSGLMVSAITLQPANGAAAVSLDGQTVVYTPRAGFAGLDSFPYVAQDVNGHTDDALVAVVVTARQQHGTAPQVAPVNLTVDSSAVFTSPQAQVDALLPAGFISTTLGEKDILFLAYTPVLTPAEKVNQAPAGFRFGNFEFDLTAYLNNVPEHGVQFAVPVTVSITYDPALVSHVQEQTLKVYYWNGTAWVDNGVTVIARDMYAHTITIAISHLSDFAFFAAAPTAAEPMPEPDALFKVYLPAVSRQD